MKYKVLQVQGGMNKGGLEAVIMGWYRNIDVENIQFDFTTCSKEELPHDKEIKERGGQIHYIPSRGEVGNIKHCYYLYKCIKNNGPYIAVHSHMNFHGGIVALVAKLAGIKTIVSHAHNTKDDGVGFKRKIEISILRKSILIFSDKLLACGVEAGKFIFGENSKFKVINNSVDDKVFMPIRNTDIDRIKEIKNKYNLNQKIILGHIGRFMNQKNHKYIIDILVELKRRKVDFNMIFIGNGELLEEIFIKIKEKGLESYVTYLGLQDDINLWLNVMDIMILPSLYEGLPVVLVEAQSSGVPCIVSTKVTDEVDLGLELIKFIDINESDISLWADCIEKTVGMRVENTELIKESLEVKGYSLTECTKQMENIYLENV